MSPRARAPESGFQTHLPKPIDPLALAEAVARLARPAGSLPAPLR